MDQGVIEPIVVWKDKETGKVCVVDGRQRVKHAIEANIRLQAAGEPTILVPGVVRAGSVIRMSQAMVSANEIRRPDTPLGKAKKMASLLERGHDEKDLALLFGCGIPTIKATLTLLDCTQSVQDAVEAGKINVAQARTLVKLPPDEQREKLGELVKAGTESTGIERKQKQREVLGVRAQPLFSAKRARQIVELLYDATPIVQGNHDYLMLRDGILDDVMRIIQEYKDGSAA
jgi:ParB family chromosome partitioning protein